jgi:hypothetical protein
MRAGGEADVRDPIGKRWNAEQTVAVGPPRDDGTVGLESKAVVLARGHGDKVAIGRGNIGLLALHHAGVTILAINFILTGMQLVRKGDGLLRLIPLLHPDRVRSLVVADSTGGVRDPEYVEMQERILPSAIRALPVELRELVRLLESAIGKKANCELVEIQPGDVPETYADVDDLMRDVGFRPSTPIDEGLKNFVAWYRNFHNA